MAFSSLGGGMRRRDLMALLGGAAVWSFAARSQQSERTRRIGVLMGFQTIRRGKSESRCCARNWQDLAGRRAITPTSTFVGAPEIPSLPRPMQPNLCGSNPM